MTANEFMNLVIVDAITIIVVAAMVYKYLKEYEDDRKGRK